MPTQQQNTIGTPPKRKKKWLMIVLIILFILVGGLGAVSYVGFRYLEKEKAREHMLSYVSGQTEFNYYKKGKGIFNVKINAANNSTYTLDRVSMKVSYLAADSSVIKDDRVFFSHFGPHSKQNMDAAANDSAVSLRVTIDTIKCPELDM